MVGMPLPCCKRYHVWNRLAASSRNDTTNSSSIAMSTTANPKPIGRGGAAAIFSIRLLLVVGQQLLGIDDEIIVPASSSHCIL
mmetsp:Transcript_17375/g.32980  ORF Transcript_17375/g.32980 Transcript_17375/m.32980 type:complete len:83 (+) Transcript_17375:1821-2069(+)